MENVFWRMLTTAGVVSAFLAVLLPARRWLTDRYAPQVRWGLWQGMAALLILGSLYPVSRHCRPPAGICPTTL